MGEPASPNAIEANKALVREYLRLLASEGQAAASRLAADDATWWIQGDWQLGGTFDRRRLVEALARVTGRFRSLTFDVHSVTAEENRVAVDMSAHGRVFEGADYRNTYHLLFFLGEGRITHVKEFTDTRYAAAFFFPGSAASLDAPASEA